MQAFFIAAPSFEGLSMRKKIASETNISRIAAAMS